MQRTGRGSDWRAHHRLQDRPHRRARACSDTASRSKRWTSPTSSRGSHALSVSDAPVQAKLDTPEGLHFAGTESRASAVETLAKLGVVDGPDRRGRRASTRSPSAAGSRCSSSSNVSPCVLLSEMNDRGLAAACEVDVGNAVTMCRPEPRLGRCGHLPGLEQQLRRRGGQVHPLPLRAGAAEPDDRRRGRSPTTPILPTPLGAREQSYGCNAGRIAPMPFTFGNLLTDEGKLKFYLGEGQFTADPIPADFFGCAGVARIPGLQEYAADHRLCGPPAPCRRHAGITRRARAGSVRQVPRVPRSRLLTAASARFGWLPVCVVRHQRTGGTRRPRASQLRSAGLSSQATSPTNHRSRTPSPARCVQRGPTSCNLDKATHPGATKENRP